ncbi:acyl-CoA reductase [Flagellimonas myxillae]|uniref:acyl-CoA reductase n=1 Tax=Flagellimonas myxillae TaxID=2942214 RepID=UPI00201F8D73|nr:acyl-CoA reductase [Muricauda myxillae]MCL6266057.1 acyl-CoA reductase [Muricauda myxillae]
MTAHNPIVQAFVKLGGFIQDFCENGNPEFQECLHRAEQQNAWFTQENLQYCLNYWASLLTEDKLNAWLDRYTLKGDGQAKTVGVIMAGNIPLVGFHDFICVLLSGHKIQAKLSSNDIVLLPYLSKQLITFEPQLADSINFVEGKLDHFDAVIATGSNNTSRYFEYYFGKKPNIIRKNRNAVTVLTGEESQEALSALGDDIFRYFGLGCRNVSKIYVPQDYDFDTFFKAIYNYRDIINQHKYANNYDYNKAVYLMSEFKILDNGFLVLKEDEGFSSPIASLFYEKFDSIDTLKQQLIARKEDIQCIVASGFAKAEIAPGHSQKPNLDDYADGVDTLDFLLKL